MSDVIVSIVLPIYKVEKYLKRCLDTLVKQTYSNLEVICIIDGSPDDSVKICESFSKNDHRIKIIEQKNCGCAKTRNRALDNSKGKYICFVDPDDYVNSTYIEKLVNEAEKNDADIVSSKMIRVGRYNKKVRTKFEGVGKYENRTDIFKSQNCPPDYYVINKMFRADMLRKHSIKFNENVSWCDDISFCVEALFCSNCVVTVDESVYYYVKRNNSIVHSHPTKKKQQERFEEQSKAVKFLYDNGVELPQKELTVTKSVISFCRIPLIRIRVDVSTQTQSYFLFGIIPIYKSDAK